MRSEYAQRQAFLNAQAIWDNREPYIDPLEIAREEREERAEEIASDWQQLKCYCLSSPLGVEYACWELLNAYQDAGSPALPGHDRPKFTCDDIEGYTVDDHFYRAAAAVAEVGLSRAVRVDPKIHRAAIWLRNEIVNVLEEEDRP